MKLMEDSNGTFRTDGFTAVPYQRHQIPHAWLVRVWKENETENILVVAETALEAAERAIALYPAYHEDQLLAFKLSSTSSKEEG